jgi:hypothetical protein
MTGHWIKKTIEIKQKGGFEYVKSFFIGKDEKHWNYGAY